MGRRWICSGSDFFFLLFFLIIIDAVSSKRVENVVN